MLTAIKRPPSISRNKKYANMSPARRGASGSSAVSMRLVFQLLMNG
jgi:hypothetical protein